MGRIIPYIMENKLHVWNHQPALNMPWEFATSSTAWTAWTASILHWGICTQAWNISHVDNTWFQLPQFQWRSVEHDTLSSSKAQNTKNHILICSEIIRHPQKWCTANTFRKQHPSFFHPIFSETPSRTGPGSHLKHSAAVGADVASGSGKTRSFLKFLLGVAILLRVDI